MPSCINGRSPCRECPWSRTTPPGGNHPGGSPVETYIGQVNGPFWLACHMRYEKGVDAKDQTPGRAPECAGAAIFRANVGLSDKLSQRLHRLPSDTKKVFADFAEFMAHHKQIMPMLARILLSRVTPDALTYQEMQRRELKVTLYPK